MRPRWSKTWCFTSCCHLVWLEIFGFLPDPKSYKAYHCVHQNFRSPVRWHLWYLHRIFQMKYLFQLTRIIYSQVRTSWLCSRMCWGPSNGRNHQIKLNLFSKPASFIPGFYWKDQTLVERSLQFMCWLCPFQLSFWWHLPYYHGNTCHHRVGREQKSRELAVMASFFFFTLSIDSSCVTEDHANTAVGLHLWAMVTTPDSAQWQWRQAQQAQPSQWPQQ